jgi:hypothetical protein
MGTLLSEVDDASIFRKGPTARHRGLSAHSRLSKEHPVPKYDLEALWEEHCRYEFETRDVDATMATMVDALYVNHIPTMTGGVGHDQLKRFYK